MNMKTTLSIPVSWVLFPITIPIAVVRIVLAVVCAAVCFPVAVVTAISADNPYAAWGWKTNYKTLSEELKKSNKEEGTSREVLIIPGWLLRLGGLPVRQVTLWELVCDYCHSRPHAKNWRYSDGKLVPSHIRRGVIDSQALATEHTQLEEQRQQKADKINSLSQV